jgi:hypothetical protein
MNHTRHPFRNPEVAEVFDSYPVVMRRKLMVLRQLIFDTAAGIESVGMLEEALKWGEPAYLTPHSKSGSTIRLAWKTARPLQYAMYFNCQTTLVDTFRTLFPADLRFEGNRAIILEASSRVPARELAWCIAAALTYHLSPTRAPG